MRATLLVCGLMLAVASGMDHEDHVSLDSDDSAMQGALGESLKSGGFGI